MVWNLEIKDGLVSHFYLRNDTAYQCQQRLEHYLGISQHIYLRRCSCSSNSSISRLLSSSGICMAIIDTTIKYKIFLILWKATLPYWNTNDKLEAFTYILEYTHIWSKQDVTYPDPHRAYSSPWQVKAGECVPWGRRWAPSTTGMV